MLAFSGAWARADYGATTSRPLSDPRRAEIDESPTGTWRAVIQDKTYYLHVGTGNIVGKLNWMELVLVNPGEKRPLFYMHHIVGFPSKIGDEKYFNVAHMSTLIPQLRGANVEQVISSVERYEAFKYEVTGDYLDVWAAEEELIREAIKAGKIKGNEASIDDTTENLLQLVLSSGPKLFVKKFRYTRIPEPPAKPSEGRAGAEKPLDSPSPAIEPKTVKTTPSSK